MELAFPGSPRLMVKRLISMVASPELTDRSAVTCDGARQRRGPSLLGMEEVAMVWPVGPWSQPLPLNRC